MFIVSPAKNTRLVFEFRPLPILHSVKRTNLQINSNIFISKLFSCNVS